MGAEHQQVALETAAARGHLRSFGREPGELDAADARPAERPHDAVGSKVLDPALGEGPPPRALVGRGAGVGDRRDLETAVGEIEREGERVVVGSTEERAPPRLYAVELDQPARAGGEQDAGQVVAVEARRVLERAGRDDQLAGAHVDQRGPLLDRDEAALVGAERQRARENADAGFVPGFVSEPAGELESVRRGLSVGRDAPVEAQVPAEPVLIVDQRHARAAARGGERGRDSRGPAADDQDLDAFVRVLPPRLGSRAQPTQTGQAADDGLGDLPGPARAREGPVIEPDRQQRIEPLKDRHPVPGERRPALLRPHLHPRPHGLDAGPDVRDAVDLHHAVRALPGDAEQAARPVVLEAARQERAPRGGQGGPDGVSRVGRHRAPVELERDRARAVDTLGAARPKAGHAGASPDFALLRS